MNDKIINRVKKMLALGNDSAATEGERDNALRMVHNILAKYNLSMADIADEEQEERVRERMEFYGRPWARTVAYASAELFFCKYFYRPSGKNKSVHSFVGRISNVATATEMAKYLINSIKREAGRKARELGQGTPYRRAFSTGAANKVWDRVKELQTQDIPDEATGRALVVVPLYKSEQKANQAFLETLGVELTRTSRKGKPLLAGAYHAGSRYGSTLNLSQQLGGKAHPSIR